MEQDTIETVVQQLQPGPYGWRCALPLSVRFFGKPIELRVETRPVPAEKPPPAPAPAELSLIRLILGNLYDVLKECERRYREYNAQFPELFDKVHEPHIWISREWLGAEPPGNWSFVVGIADAPDWGIHTEFSGLEFREIWSGD